MGKILCFVYDTMADFEVSLAGTMISGKKYRVVPVGENRTTVSAMSGLAISPAATLDEALTWDDVDGLLIPGGVPKHQPPALTELIRKLDGQGKLLAAICAGPVFLARAGILQGRKFTHSADAADLARFDASDPFPACGFTGGGVVRDGNVITAPGNLFVDFAGEIMERLGLFSGPQDREEWSKEFKGLSR